MSFRFLSPDMRARTQLTRWETSQNMFLDEADKQLITTFMARIFALEDLEHLEPAAVDQTPLFSAEELKQIDELIEKYPVLATIILDFFANYLPPTETETKE